MLVETECTIWIKKSLAHLQLGEPRLNSISCIEVCPIGQLSNLKLEAILQLPSQGAVSDYELGDL